MTVKISTGKVKSAYRGGRIPLQGTWLVPTGSIAFPAKRRQAGFRASSGGSRLPSRRVIGAHRPEAANCMPISGVCPHDFRNCRLFYQAYPTESAIRYALRIKLSWTHHRAIMRVGDPKAREYYLREASGRNLSARDVEREIRNMAYQRIMANQTLVAQGDDATLALTPERLLKDPCVAEFLNLRGDLRGKEKKVEKRILDNIEKFILELGKGFSLVGRQVRVPTETTEKYIDFVFYNYILKCFVLVDLKTARLTSRDIGQMDTYRRMCDALIKPKEDQPTIGILLGTEVDESDVEYSVMSECKRLFATKLLPYMPTKAELQFEIERARSRRIK